MTDSDLHREDAESPEHEEPMNTTPPSGQQEPTLRKPFEPEVSIEEPPDRGPWREEAIEERARKAVEKVVETAQERAKSTLSSQKERVAESLGATAEALRRSAEDLREQGYGAPATYADQLATKVERFAETLHSRTVDELQAEVEDYAHRRPGVLIGAAFVLGFLTARLFMQPKRR